MHVSRLSSRSMCQLVTHGLAHGAVLDVQVVNGAFGPAICSVNVAVDLAGCKVYVAGEDANAASPVSRLVVICCSC